MSRDAAIAGFLASAGHADAAVAPLAQDASFRRYLRVAGGMVLMDAPPILSTETCTPSSMATSRMSEASVMPPTRPSLMVMPSAAPPR